jgi:hypothetical protein
MGFHVGLSVYDRMRGLAVHILFLLAFAYLLFRADAAEYFRSTKNLNERGLPKGSP